MASDAPLPKAVVFDLDYTLWPYWVDTHIDPPLKRRNDALNEVVDRSGLKLGFFRDVPSILLELKDRGVHVAAASRTAAPAVARQALRELMIDQGDTVHTRPPRQTGRASERKNVTKAIHLFDQLEIYPGSKVAHFSNIAKASGVEYRDMIFFDDEHRNAEVERKLGVHFVLVGNQGLDRANFDRGIAEWRKKRGH
ncbi:protein-tyrosine-phosphatase [Malassezia furfur]|uniref:Protein-tyrosine-phosphatase n=1 Tax=Malassezia furfur TaxID=55194 RepID=A0ABY8EQJ7_MALFU|nr:protein-tyrosine-phosphatase [Malassezia furfur]